MSVRAGLIGSVILFGGLSGGPPAAAGEYDVSAEHSFGRPHPEAAEKLSDFAFAIGRWGCESRIRQPDGEWAVEPLAWEFRYILNGRAIQDYFETESVRGMGIRQISPADGKWHVAYHSEHPNYANAMWEGESIDGAIVLNRVIARPDGSEVNLRLTFANMSDDGFDWTGENVVGEDATTFWQIACRREE